MRAFLALMLNGCVVVSAGENPAEIVVLGGVDAAGRVDPSLRYEVELETTDVPVTTTTVELSTITATVLDANAQQVAIAAPRYALPAGSSFLGVQVSSRTPLGVTWLGVVPYVFADGAWRMVEIPQWTCGASVCDAPSVGSITGLRITGDRVLIDYHATSGVTLTANAALDELTYRDASGAAVPLTNPSLSFVPVVSGPFTDLLRSADYLITFSVTLVS